MQIEKMKFPVIIPNVVYTSFFEYVLSVMVTNSSSRGAQISSYLLQAMKERKDIKFIKCIRDRNFARRKLQSTVLTMKSACK